MRISSLNRRYLILLKVFVTMGFVMVIVENVDLGSTLQLLRRLNIYYFLGAFVMLAIQSFIAVVRWQLILSKLGVSIIFRNSVCYFWIGLFFNQALPSSVGGDALRGYYLCREGYSLGRATLGVLLDRFLGIIGLVMLVLVTLPFFFGYVNDSHVYGGILVVTVVAVGIIILILVLDILPDYLANWRIVRGLFVLAREARKLIFSLRLGGGLLVISLLIHLMSIFTVMILVNGLGMKINWEGILFVIPIATLAMTVPISIAGWGVREGVLVVGLGYFGVVPEESLALSVLYGLSLLSIALPGGIVWLMRGKAQVSCAS